MHKGLLYYRLLNHVSLLLLKIMLERLYLNINLILDHELFLWNGAVKIEWMGESPRMFSEIPDTHYHLAFWKGFTDFSLPQGCTWVPLLLLQHQLVPSKHVANFVGKTTFLIISHFISLTTQEANFFPMFLS